MTEYMSEVFGRIAKAKTRKAKKEILESLKDNNVFKFILQGAFDPSIKWTITKLPKYTKSNGKPIDLHDCNLFVTVPKCSLFVKGHAKSEKLTEEKSVELLTQMLEIMHEDESAIFAGMIKKKLKVKGLTEKLVLEVFPDLYRKV